MGWLTRRLLAISDAEVSFDHRRFPGADQAARGHLERVAGGFLAGYRRAAEDDDLATLGERLGQEPHELQGFAFEGAAMALTILDFMQPWRRPRLPDYLRGPAARHIYLALVGVGWGYARLPLRLEPLMRRLDTVMAFLAPDGYGFHQAFFHGDATVLRHHVPKQLRGYARHVFDQGVGRALWFYEGANPERLAARIALFPADRHGDLWSGVGLACCYAGGVDEATLELLRRLGAGFAAELAQGVAFAVAARELAGNSTSATALACRVFWLAGVTEVAALADEAGADLHGRDLGLTEAAPPYQLWRQRLQDRHRAFAEHHPQGNKEQPWPSPLRSSAGTR